MLSYLEGSPTQGRVGNPKAEESTFPKPPLSSAINIQQREQQANNIPPFSALWCGIDSVYSYT